MIHYLVNLLSTKFRLLNIDDLNFLTKIVRIAIASSITYYVVYICLHLAGYWQKLAKLFCGIFVLDIAIIIFQCNHRPDPITQPKLEVDLISNCGDENPPTKRCDTDPKCIDSAKINEDVHVHVVENDKGETTPLDKDTMKDLSVSVTPDKLEENTLPLTIENVEKYINSKTPKLA